MKLQSKVFENEGMIPSKYTCDGDNFSPDLNWTDSPEGTKSFALIFEDPGAPGGVFVHWMIYNIPGDISSLPESISFKNLPGNSKQLVNHFGDADYGGPCPPKGIHRYYFKLFALDELINLKNGAGKRDLLKRIEGHILETAELMGKYERIM